MDNEKILNSLYELIEKKYYSYFDSIEYVEWAVFLSKKNGIENKNILILAGLDDSDEYERELYFNKVLVDLNIQIPLDESKILKIFTQKLAVNVIAGIIKPIEGLDIMLRISQSLEYSKYMQFFILEEDIDRLKYNDCFFYNLDLTNDNIEEMIINEFKLFIELESAKLDIDNKAYCLKCDSIIEPIIKSKFSFRKPHRIGEHRCTKCNSKKLIHGYNQKGKRFILDKIKENRNLN